MVSNMIGDVMPMTVSVSMPMSVSMMSSSMEVVENIVPGKVVAGAPERTGHPGV